MPETSSLYECNYYILMLLLMTWSVFSTPLRASGIGGEDCCADELVKKGFENVHVTKRHDTLFVGFENRVYRWEVRGLAEAIILLMPLLDDSATLSLTCLQTGIPVVTVLLTKQQYLGLVTQTSSTETFTASVKALLPVTSYKQVTERKPGLNRSYAKFDFFVSPLFRAQFSNFDQPLEMELGIVPSVQVSFVKGMRLLAQVILPVYNNLEPKGYHIRPGLMVLSQTFRLPGNLFATIGAGYFTRNRYGINGEVRKYFFNGKLALGASLGYTGSAAIQNGRWVYTGITTFTWGADAAYRFSKPDLTVKAGYGRYLFGDMGWRVDVSREFGEISIGFFAMQTGGITNGGFNFIVPIPPRRYSTKHAVRVRPASYVPWEYRAVGLPPQGRMYSTGTGIKEFMFNLNPDYIRTHLANEIIRNIKN